MKRLTMRQAVLMRVRMSMTFIVDLERGAFCRPHPQPQTMVDVLVPCYHQTGLPLRSETAIEMKRQEKVQLIVQKYSVALLDMLED